MYINSFIFGPMISMGAPAFSWWESKRLEYNLKFISCLLIAQLLFFLVAISNVGLAEFDIVRRIMGAIVTDVIFLLALNIIYFAWPIVELVIFRKINIIFRKYMYALLNILNLIIVIGALLIVFLSKL